MRSPVFLSASIPDREPFVHYSDPMAIREAVLALVAVTVRERPLVFGGHPAISPLVEHAARSLDAAHNVHIYQSAWFEDVIPPEARAFENFHWTPKGESKAESLEIMRERMIGSAPFGAAFFIGGMEGIEDECRIFKRLHAGAPLFPVSSTQGATRDLAERGEGPEDSTIRHRLANDKKYRALFRQLLDMIPDTPPKKR